MRWSALLAVGLLAVSSPAWASDDDPDVSPHPRASIDEPNKDRAPFTFRDVSGWRDLTSKAAVSGYVLPQFQVVTLDTALPRDKVQYGAKGTRAGFVLHGTPFPRFTYVAHLVLAPAGVENVTLLSPSSASIGFVLNTTTGTTIDFEELSLGYRPLPFLQLKTGFMRLPFSLAQTTPIPKQAMPFRSPVTGEFQSGADPAMLASVRVLDEKLTLNASAFLGSSLGTVANPGQTVRGIAVLGSVVAQPLGPMSTLEGDPGRGPLRIAFGIGSIYRRSTAFDPTGYEASSFDDVRLAAWARASIRGFYAQGEYLRRNRTDDVSGRPNRSEGFYAQASYFVPVQRFGFAPLLRAGQIETSADFAARTFRSFEAGFAFFPRARVKEPERLRILLEYFLAHVSPLDETQHEALLQLQMEF